MEIIESVHRDENHTKWTTRKIEECERIKEEEKRDRLNNKAEYNRCALPRLTAKLGEKDLEK